jgi:hypothetical protein
MFSHERTIRLVRLLGLGLALLAGCAGPPRAFVIADPDYASERARSTILVLPGPRVAGAPGIARAAAHTLAAELGSRWFNVVEVDHLLRSNPALEAPLGRAALQALNGEPIDQGLAERLLTGYGIGQLMVVDVYQYEQYWGRQTKITRVGMEARLVQIPRGRILWQGRYDPELSGYAGHGYEAATQRAVRELVRALTGGPAVAADYTDWNWPVVEYFEPNSN